MMPHWHCIEGHGLHPIIMIMCSNPPAPSLPKAMLLCQWRTMCTERSSSWTSQCLGVADAVQSVPRYCHQCHCDVASEVNASFCRSCSISWTVAGPAPCQSLFVIEVEEALCWLPGGASCLAAASVRSSIEELGNVELQLVQCIKASAMYKGYALKYFKVAHNFK